MKLPRTPFELIGLHRANVKDRVKEHLRPLVRSYAKRRVDLSPERWGLEVKEGRLAYQGHDLHGLVERWGTPLHVVLGHRLRKNVTDFTAAPPGRERGCEVYYSYKTNPIPGVLRYMHARGVGAEVISHYELWLALKLGVPPEKIVYNGPAKSIESLHMAIEKEIGLLNVNHFEEIKLMAALARKLGKRPRIAIRVATSLGWAGQFGIPIAGGLALAAFEEALSYPELEVVGLHSHLGLWIEQEGRLRDFVSAVLDFTAVLLQRTGMALSILDLGGSLGTPSVEHIDRLGGMLNQTFRTDLLPPVVDGRLSIARYVEVVTGMVDERFRALGQPAPRIFLEPGRAMTGDTQLLLASVMTTRHDDHDAITYAIMDAGVNLAECVKWEYHQLFPVNRYAERSARTYRLAGPICTPGDVIYAAWDLPVLQPGDTLAVMDSGAYFVPFATSFSFPQPGVVLVDDGAVSLLRRAETFEDLIALDEGLPR